jgi:hypothetical protein
MFKTSRVKRSRVFVLARSLTAEDMALELGAE